MMKRLGPVVLIIAAACALMQAPDDRLLPAGTWGGKNAGMIVSDSGAHLHIGCTLGEVVVPIAVDAFGRFNVAESHNLTAYPVNRGIFLPARLTGQQDLLSLAITVTVDDTVNHTTVVLGPIRLRWGERPEMGPCPICTTPGDRMRAGARANQ
jgi:hypothetical protein